MDRVDLLTGLALAVGLVLIALVENALTSFGFSTLSTIVWMMGYATLVILAWYVWIRPLDFQASAGDADSIWTEESPDDRE